MARADGPFGAYARFSPSSGLPATFSPHAGRRDKRRQLNSAFTARSRERAGAAYPFSPLAQGCPGKVPGESKCRRRMPRQTAFFRLFSGCRDSEKETEQGLSGILCGGPVSSVEEPLAKDDGELCLCLDPFPRRPFPLLGRVVKNEI